MAVTFASGLEMGSASDFTGRSGTLGTGLSVVAGGYNGAYCLRNDGSGSGQVASAVPDATSQTKSISAHYRFYDLSTPPSADFANLLFGGFGTNIEFWITTAGVKTIRIMDNAETTTYGTCDVSSLITDTSHWYHFDISLSNQGTAGSGAVTVRLDGTTVLSLTGLSLASDNSNFWANSCWNGAHHRQVDCDNIVQTNDASGVGRNASIIKRQFNGNSTTENTWTTIAPTTSTKYAVISETPSNATNHLTSASTKTADAQTFTINSFSTSESGNAGTGTVGASDTIVTVYMTGFMYSSSSSGAPSFSFRQRTSGGVDNTDSNIGTLATTTALFSNSAYSGGVFQFSSISVINNSEWGFVKGNTTQARTQTVNDAWVQVVYVPTAATESFFPGLLRRRRVFW